MLLRVDGLRVEYHKVPAVRDLHLEVAEGEIVALVGPNGAGKSTTSLAIAGMVRSTAGSIMFDGIEISRQSPETIARSGLTLVPEGRRIFGRMSVQDNLLVGTRMPRATAGVSKQLDRVYTLFPILAERRNSAGGQLSGGEQQQLAIARAMLTRPRLMIVDEPSLGLAPRFVDLVFETFDQLKREGLTILIIEQSSRRALTLADRIYLLRSGAISMSGKADDLAADPRFEAAYFGEAASL